MTSETWKRITALDAERRAIENRIRIRGALARNENQYRNVETGKKEAITPAILYAIKQGPSSSMDAERYVEIEDECWRLLGLKGTGAHQSMRG